LVSKGILSHAQLRSMTVRAAIHSEPDDVHATLSDAGAVVLSLR